MTSELKAVQLYDDLAGKPFRTRRAATRRAKASGRISLL
jgi:hypothetical protein